MKNLIKIICLLLVLTWTACDEDALMPTDAQGLEASSKADEKDKALQATGDVQVTFYSMGGENGNGGGESNASEDNLKYAHVVFDAHEADKKNPAKGNIIIDMTDAYGTIKRQFVSEVYDVLVDPDLNKANILALVISDTKTESDDTDHDHGDGGHEDGGHEDGGHSDGNHEDGDHEDGDHEDHGGNDTPKGNQSRVGQVLAVTVIDGGTPGIQGDLMGWKWFGKNNPNTPSLDRPNGWANLENRVIIDGNLVVHIK